MGGFWRDRRKGDFTVERRKIGPRRVIPSRPDKDEPLLRAEGPLAREVRRSLQASPLRFPSHWIKD